MMYLWLIRHCINVKILDGLVLKCMENELFIKKFIRTIVDFQFESVTTTHLGIVFEVSFRKL